MINNLPTNSDSYFYFTQISLEGILKFLGQWSNDHFEALQFLQLQGTHGQGQKRRTLGFTESLTNLVTSSSSVSSSGPTASGAPTALLDEVSNRIVQVADFLTDESSTVPTTPTDWIPNEQMTATSGSAQAVTSIVQRAFYRNNLDIASVLRTVLDYYESFSKNPCLQLKLDILRSMLYLANSLFDSRQQFEALTAKLQFSCEWLNSFIQQDIDNIGVCLKFFVKISF